MRWGCDKGECERGWRDRPAKGSREWVVRLPSFAFSNLTYRNIMSKCESAASQHTVYCVNAYAEDALGMWPRGMWEGMEGQAGQGFTGVGCTSAEFRIFESNTVDMSCLRVTTLNLWATVMTKHCVVPLACWCQEVSGSMIYNTVKCCISARDTWVERILHTFIPISDWGQLALFIMYRWGVAFVWVSNAVSVKPLCHILNVACVSLETWWAYHHGTKLCAHPRNRDGFMRLLDVLLLVIHACGTVYVVVMADSARFSVLTPYYTLATSNTHFVIFANIWE